MAELTLTAFSFAHGPPARRLDPPDVSPLSTMSRVDDSLTVSEADRRWEWTLHRASSGLSAQMVQSFHHSLQPAPEPSATRLHTISSHG